MKAIKKIAALATGVTMLGATVMGAMALDLKDYPKPFVDGCSFSGAIVVGRNAATSDTIGAVDIATTLAVSGTSTGTTSGTSVSAVGEAHKIETDTNKLNIGDTLVSVQTVDLDNDDLPTILADGTYRNGESNDYDYEQIIKLAGGLRFAHWSDSDYKDKTPTLGLNIPDGTNVFNYTLDWSKNPVSDVDTNGDLEDFEDTSLVVMGKTYDIVEADNATNVKLQLMSGATKDVLEQGQVQSYTIGDKKYDVEVTYIGGTPSKVKLKVNGEVTKALEEDATYKLSDGTQIGIREILEEEAGEVTADQVEFYIGAEKLTIESGQKLEVNDEDVDEVVGYITRSQTGARTELDKMTLVWTVDDDSFVVKDTELHMPGIDAVKLSYEGLTTAAQEKTSVSPNGRKIIELKTTIKSGDASFYLLGSNGTVFNRIGGDDNNEILNTVAGAGAALNYNKSEDKYFVATYYGGAGSADGESYLLEVSSIDDDDGIDVRDVVAGRLVAEDKKNLTSFTVGSATLTVTNINEGAKTVTLTGGATTYFDRLITKEGLFIYLPVEGTATTPAINFTALPTTYTLMMREENKDGALAAGNWINVSLAHKTDNEVKVNGLTDAAEATLSGAADFEDGDTDIYVGYMASELGTKTVYDSDDQGDFYVEYPGSQAYGNVYIGEVAARFEQSAAGGASVCKVTVPSAVFDDDITSTSAQNLIIVGGPCANSVAAKVMGISQSEPACYASFEQGKATIKLYDTGAGKTAMVVAGMTGTDTQRAARVLKNYDQYSALSGDEVEVVGTTFSDISVKSVA